MITLTKFDRSVLLLNRILIGLLVLITLSPLLYVLIASFMDPFILRSQGLSLNPANWSLDGYNRVLKDPAIIRGFVNSIFYSFTYSALTVGVSILTAYPLSRTKTGRQTTANNLFYNHDVHRWRVGSYLFISEKPGHVEYRLGNYPSRLNQCLEHHLGPDVLSTIARRVGGAAIIDGANELQIFFKIMLPLAKPIIFVLFLYAFVGQWNSYFDAMIYLNDADLQPLQLVLRKILIQNQPQQDMIGSATQMAEMAQLAELIKYSTIVISSLPLLIMYPFFQKYFDKGMMAGSLKG